jgi:hypothetical protein
MKATGVGIIILAAILLAGCTGQPQPPAKIVPPTTPQQATPPLAPLEPSQMALQLSDYPQGYSIVERGEKLSSDVTPEARNLGYIKGYTMLVRTIASNNIEYTIIGQTISIYPKENTIKVLALGLNSSWIKLSDPQIGDQSQAFRITDPETQLNRYIIDFSKNNVFERFIMVGTSTDYELLKSLAQKAVSKIQ